MTPDDLAKSCLEAFSRSEALLSGEANVGIAGSRGKIPLPKKSFPKWKYVINTDQGTVYYYDARAILRALVYHGLINLDDYRKPEGFAA